MDRFKRFGRTGTRIAFGTSVAACLWWLPAHAGDTDLVVSGVQGLVAVSLPGSPSPGPSPGVPARLDEHKTARRLVNWLAYLMVQEADNSLSEGRKTRRRARILNKELTRRFRFALDRQIHPRKRAPIARGGKLGLFATVQTVTHVDLSMDEPLTVTTTVAGRTYTAFLDRTRSGASDPGQRVQIRYNIPGDPADGGVLFAALLRESIRPSVGVLLTAVLDSTFQPVLEPFGITNETVARRPVDIPFSLGLSGSPAGLRTAPAEHLEGEYHAVQYVIGLAVPAYFRLQTEELTYSYGLPLAPAGRP